MENSMIIPQKMKNRITRWSNNSTSGYISKRIETGIQADIYAPVFRAALFAMAKNRSKPHVHEQICIHVHTRKYYSALKRKEVLTHATTWMNLEDMLSEISQTQKTSMLLFHLQIPRNRIEWWLPGAGGRGNGELVFSANRVPAWEDATDLDMDGGRGCTKMWMDFMPLNCILKTVKMVKWILRILFYTT